MSVAKNIRSFAGERCETKSTFLSATSEALLIGGVEGVRSVIAIRFVNLTPDGPFKPAIWFCPRGVTPSSPDERNYRFYPPGMEVKVNTAFMEPGTLESPLYVIGYGTTMYARALEGYGNIFYTISEDCR